MDTVVTSGVAIRRDRLFSRSCGCVVTNRMIKFDGSQQYDRNERGNRLLQQHDDSGCHDD